MPLNWNVTMMSGGNAEESDVIEMHRVIDEFSDLASILLRTAGLEPHESPIFRPFSIAVFQDSEKIIAVFESISGGGMPSMSWMTNPHATVSVDDVVTFARNEGGIVADAVVVLPRPGIVSSIDMNVAARSHVAEIERATAFKRLGDTDHVRHLDTFLRKFLEDHPEPDRNVFVMMRFSGSKQMQETFDAIKSTLADRGMNAIRADDRDYTGELWSNVEVYLTGCTYGIAVFEDIDQRDYNPNVSLELGYLMGRGKRTLLLKEQRLARLPTDVVHRLYKEFDMFEIKESVTREVARWVDVDLALRF